MEQLEKERQIRSAKIDEFNGLIDSKRHHTTFLLQDLTRLQSERADYTEQSLNQRLILNYLKSLEYQTLVSDRKTDSFLKSRFFIGYDFSGQNRHLQPRISGL